MKKITIIMLVCLAAGCSKHSQSGEALYSEAVNGTAIDIPRPLTDSNISHFYDLPPQPQNSQVNIEPPQ